MTNKEVFTYLSKSPLKRDHLSFLDWLILLLLNISYSIIEMTGNESRWEMMRPLVLNYCKLRNNSFIIVILLSYIAHMLNDIIKGIMAFNKWIPTYLFCL